MKLQVASSDKIEKALLGFRDGLSARIASLETRYAKGEVEKEDYQCNRDSIWDSLLACQLALSIISLCKRIGAKAAIQADKMFSEKRKRGLVALVERKNSALERLASLQGTILEKPGKKSIAGLNALHSEILELEHSLKALLAEDCLDMARHANEMENLGENLQRIRTKEAENKATLEIVDELVISVPKHIALERHAHPRRWDGKRKSCKTI